MIRIHLIEDHAIFRRSLVEELNALEGMQVVAEHSSMEAALAFLTESAPEDAADLLLIDFGLAPQELVVVRLLADQMGLSIHTVDG